MMSTTHAALSDFKIRSPRGDVSARAEVAFIDPGVSDIPTLFAGMRPEVEAILLDIKLPALSQIAAALRGRRDLDAIHIIAHGAPGEVRFTTGRLSVETIDACASELAELGNALDEDGDLRLWSCRTGAGATGVNFVGTLAHRIGARVAAGADPVGDESRGGTWRIFRGDSTAAAAPLSADGIDSYRGLLANFVGITTIDGNSVTSDPFLNAAEYSTWQTSGLVVAGTDSWSGSKTITVTITDGSKSVSETVSVNGSQTGTWSVTFTPATLTALGFSSGDKLVFSAAVSGVGTDTHNITASTIDPTVLSVTDSTNSPNLTAGTQVTLTLKFSENVTVGTGTTLQLSNGGTATYSGGSGTGTLTFTYTPAKSATGVTVTGVASGSIKDGAGNPATGFGETICFMQGTRVATPSGQAAVETLKIGDLVTTADGHAAPVRWIGRQTISRVFADPLRVMPIRIQAGALEESLPSRDLLLSTDHAILVGGVLIQAGALVNGSSIRRETDVPVTFTYYHVELDDHALILAEGVPAETFIDNVDRLSFDNWEEHETLYPDGHAMRELPYARAQARRQVPHHVRQQLAERAVKLLERDTASAA